MILQLWIHFLVWINAPITCIRELCSCKIGHCKGRAAHAVRTGFCNIKSTQARAQSKVDAETLI